MNTPLVNRVSGRVLLALSLIALFTVLSGFLLHPHEPPETDEGAAAHIFQISVTLAAFAILVFLFTADWKQPLQSARSLAIPLGALALAFAILYYFEHVRRA
jgi:hypothetical protein